MRVAIYARYSSDLQSRASIEDQIRLAREHAERQGWTIVEIYTDYGISGASMVRPGLQALLADAQLGKFDTLLSEALDRISRDQGDTANIHKRMRFHGIGIYTLSEGWVDTIQVGFKGMMNQMFLTEMAAKIRRGQRGRVESGKVTAGLGYGYEVVRAFDDRGRPVRGERKIKPEEAAIVTRIFEEFAAARSAKAIAQALNSDGIRSPSGKGWTYASICGSRARGTGIINNEMYVGKVVWNRIRELRDPDTHQRIVRINPPEEWVVHDAEHLRIIDDQLWKRAKARQGAQSTPDGDFWKKRPAKHLFSGLIRCGLCDGAYTKYSRDHFRCSTHQNKRQCTNRLAMSKTRLEEVVLLALKTHLLDEALLDEFRKEYTRRIAAIRKERGARRASLETALAHVIAKRDKLITAVGEGLVPSAEIKPDLDAAIRRRDELKSELAQCESDPPFVQPGLSTRYRTVVGQLIEAFHDSAKQDEAMHHLRALIEKIVVRPNPAGDDLEIDLHGDLAAILTIALASERHHNTENRLKNGLRRPEAKDDLFQSNQRSGGNRGASSRSVKLVGLAGHSHYYSDLFNVLERLGPLNGLFSAFDVTGAGHA